MEGEEPREAGLLYGPPGRRRDQAPPLGAMAEAEVPVEVRGGGELANARQGQSGPAPSAELPAGSGDGLRRADAAGQAGAGCGGNALEACGNGKAGGGGRPESLSPPAARSAPAKRARVSPRMDGYLSSINGSSMFGNGVLPLSQAAWTPYEQPAVAQGLDFGSGKGSGLAGSSKGRCKAGASRIKLANFSVHEDINVVTSWLQVSYDPVSTIGQKRESFWVRIVKQYNANRGIYPERTKRSVMCRFDVIKAEVRKFSRYMEEILCRNPNGASDADKTGEAAARFAVVEKHNFTLLHCWNILKDEPKWLELKSKEWKSKTARDEEEPLREHTPHGSNSFDPDTDLSSPPNSTGEQPLEVDAAKEAHADWTAEQPHGMDAAKEAHKKSASTSALAASSEHASKLYDHTLEKLSYFKEMEEERKNRLAMIISLEKDTIAELREHRLRMIELEERRLAIEAQRVEMKRKRDEKAEDERILAINLDKCLPAQRLYYQALQEEIIAKVKSRRR